MATIIDQSRWGICGFVSVLNGLRSAGVLTKFTGTGETPLSLDEIQVRLYAEILTYLKYLVFTKSDLVDEIEGISAALKPKDEPKRSLPQLILYVETWLRDIAKRGGGEERIRERMRGMLDVRDELAVTVAMTPAALIDYMRWVGLRGASDLKVQTTAHNGKALLSYPNCVIGLGEHSGTDRPYGGLEHWVYVDSNGTLHNWGGTKPVKESSKGTDLVDSWALFITHVIRLG